ncbi:MAG: MBL fold metallo-hydrolase [Planctomycetaceae bacterium]|nr:MBL fold metallo-hydrolase [Planctomycetaceae bacterium]
MQYTVTELAADIFRISTFHPDYRIEFNQFLIRDDEPFLMHTGMRGMFQTTLEGVTTIIDPSTLRWIGFSHFESDECGAMNDWLAAAPRAQGVCSFVAAMVNLGDFAIRPPRPLADGEILPLGRHRLQFLATPHLPHGWDAGLFFDQTQRTLLCSDLFFQGGNCPPVAGPEIIERATKAIRASRSGPLAHDMPYTPHTDSMLNRLAALDPQAIAAMHGSSFQGDGHKALTALAAEIKSLLSTPEP